MPNQIVRNSLVPNLYVDKIHVDEYDNKILINLILSCANSTEDNWRTINILPFMNMNASLLIAPDLNSRPLMLDTGVESNTIESIDHVINGHRLISENSPHCTTIPASSHISIDIMNDISYYKYKYSFMVSRPDDIDLNEMYVFAWCSINLNSLELNRAAEFSFSNNKNLRGPMKCEAIKKGGTLVQSTNFYRVDITQEIWPGPVFTDSNGDLRGGSYEGHSANPPLIKKYRKSNSKILYNDYTEKSFLTTTFLTDMVTTANTTSPLVSNTKVGDRTIPSRRKKPVWFPSLVKNKMLRPGYVASPFRRRLDRMPKPKIPKPIRKPDMLPSVYEMGMTIDSNDDLQNIFIVDLANMCQGKSFVGDLIYKVDPILHSQISNTIQIDDIVINRSLVRPRLQNQRFSKFGNRRLNSKKFKKQIKIPANKNINKMESLFNNTELLHTKNDNFKLNKKTFFRKRNVVDEGLTAEKTKIASIEQLDVAMENKVRAIQFTDHEVDKLPRGEYSYSITIKSKDQYVNYIKNLLEDIDAFRTRLFEYHQHIIKNRLYDYDSLMFKEKYLRSFFRSHGIEYNNRQIDVANITSSSLRESFFIRGSNKLSRLCQLTLMPFFSDVFLKKVIPTLASPESILHAIKEIDDIYMLAEKFYKIRPTKDGGASIGTKNTNIKNLITLNHRFQNTHVVNPKKKIKYKFMKFDKKAPLKLKKSQFKQRANREVAKYFKGKPSTRGIELPGVSNTKINSLINIQENSYLHFTPEEIKIGDMMLDNTTLANNFKNNDAFNLLQVSRFVEDFESEDELETRAEKLEKIRNKLNLIDASDFMGENSPSILNLVNVINEKPEKLLKNKKSLRQISIAMASSKTQKKRINKIDLLDISKKDNIFMKSLRKKNFDAKKMPVQLKSLLFSRSSMAKNKILEKGFDIFSNPLTSEMAFQNFINIKKVQYFDGFEKNDNGNNIMSKPIFKDMDGVNYNSIKGKSKLCKLVSGFDNAIFKNKTEDFTSEGELFLLEDDDTSEVEDPQGLTTMNAGHSHSYNVDENGNGYTDFAIHPENENIKHRHKIINNVIQVAASDCYPNCNDLHGVDGAAPHLHKYVTDNATQTSLASSSMSQEELEMTNVSTQLMIETSAFAKNLFSSSVEVKQNRDFNSVESPVGVSGVVIDTASEDESVFSSSAATSMQASPSMGGTSSGY